MVFTKYDLKRKVLLVVSVLPLVLVRNDIQYEYYVDESVLVFLGSWLVHYFALILIAAFANFAMNKFRRIFFALDEGEEIKLDMTIYHAAFFSIFISLTIFILKNRPAYDFGGL